MACCVNVPYSLLSIVVAATAAHIAYTENEFRLFDHVHECSVSAITSNNNNDNDHSFVHCNAESDPVAQSTWKYQQ